MTRDETIALFQRCEQARADALAAGKEEYEAHEAAKAIWNGWAEKILDKRRDLKVKGLFQLKPERTGDWIAPRHRGSNRQTIDFLDQSRVDFSGFSFSDFTNFCGFIFPGETIFSNRRNGASVFNSDAKFDGCIFYGHLLFESVHFRASFNASRAKFHDNVDFAMAEFQGFSLFEDSTFHSESWFGDAKFHSHVNLRGALFRGVIAFRGAEFSRGFDMARANFFEVPDFTQAHFAEAPRLDNVSVPQLPLWQSCDEDMVARYRALKRLANQSHDQDKEQQFFKSELRARRKAIDHWYEPRFYFSLLYDVVSECGRSIIRPAIAWATLVTLFAAIYLGVSADMNGRAPDYHSLAPQGGTQACLSVTPVADERVRPAQAQIAATTSASAESWSLALKNGFVFIDWDRAEAARRTYGCLFGLTSDGSNTYPVVPRAVSVWGLIQNVLSAVLIFLLLLGVRNLLKLK